MRSLGLAAASIVRGFFRATAYRAVFVSAASAFLALSFAAEVAAGTFTVFGAQTYERSRQDPQILESTFPVISPDTPYFIEIENGPSGAKRISSAVITINGVAVVTPEDLNQKVAQVSKPVLLDETNQIAVELRGTPGAALSVTVSGIDAAPPAISATLSPEPNIHGWNNTDVIVSFDCSDEISGIASCPDPVTLTSETTGEVVTGTALDNAGNTADISVTVRLDRTPPGITRTWPPASEFSTDRPSIAIEGTVADNLSGVAETLLQDAQGTTPLPVPDFAASGALDTDLAPGTLWTDNQFQLRATDKAGNLTQESFLVRYTLAAHTLPTDRATTELEDGLLTSVERAMVRFAPSVARENIHDVIAQDGGRVVGFLPAGNIAIAEFGTEHVADLNNVLNSLKSRGEVEAAVPVIFLPDIQFDNELLSPVQRAAYDNIHSVQAKDQLILQTQLALNPVNIAVIETGLDDSHGLSNEFADIDFYDLCTAAGRAGQTGTPVDTLPEAHGTKITGILAGANNGNGNNGVVRGIAGSQFGVHVLRMNCDGSNDPALVGLAMDLIVSGAIGDIDVVNMSFGAIFANPTRRAEVQAIYEAYFDSAAGRKILWVGGAGNDNQQIACNEFLPSGLACDLDNVISVGGYNPDDLIRGIWIASDGEVFGSNYGAGVTLSAPGTDVWTATGPGTYGGVNGTSASTPLVTGAAALMLAASPLSPSTLKQLLVSEVQPLPDPTLPEGGLDILAALEPVASRALIVTRGLQWLRDQQNPNGSFSRPATGLTPEERSVTSTALAALAFLNFGIDESDPDLSDALDWILGRQNGDGSISNENQRFPPKTLDTSFAIQALLATRNPDYHSAVQQAANYLVAAQHNEAAGYPVNSGFYGGWTEFYPDYSPLIDWYSLPVLEPATGMALLALHFAERLADATVPANVRNKAELFVTRCQNSAVTNPDFNYTICFDGVCSYDDGGFAVYPPGGPGPWAELLGRDSYAGGTAAGLWSLYAVGADRLDPRVELAQIWLGDELVSGAIDDNHPFGDRNYYHYLYYLAVAGAAWEWDEYDLGAHLGEQIDWHEMIAEAVAVRQNADGHWTGGARETDIEATALAILALESKWTPAGTGLRFGN